MRGISEGRTLRIFIDSAELADIVKYDADPNISGFTTNATLVKRAGADVDKLIASTRKDISVERGASSYSNLGSHVRWKITDPKPIDPFRNERWNLTAVCSRSQVPIGLPRDTIISVFAGRIMDTGRSPEPVIEAAKRTDGRVLWASSRSVYDITMAEQMGCDIITVTPAIYEKYREWNGKPLELVAEETIAQFERDR